MARIRSRGNQDTELALAKLLRAHGITGWRRHVPILGRAALPRGPNFGAARQLRPTIRVRPDFAFRQARGLVRGADLRVCFAETRRAERRTRNQTRRAADLADVKPLIVAHQR